MVPNNTNDTSSAATPLALPQIADCGASDLAKLLTAARAFIEQHSEESGYGFARPPNPHDFHPDGESCSPEEIAAHKAACDAFDKGEYKPEGGCKREGGMHILVAPWGIGSYTYRDEQALAIMAEIDAHLAREAQS